MQGANIVLQTVLLVSENASIKTIKEKSERSSDVQVGIEHMQRNLSKQLECKGQLILPDYASS